MNADFFWPSNPWQGGGFLLVLASCVVCVCVHACACVHVDVCVHVCGGGNAVLAVLHGRDLYT